MEASNMKAMREAMEEISIYARSLCKFRNADVNYDANKILDLVRAALAAPPRNCDVGTAEEQERRFAELCTSHSKDGARGICDEKCPFYGKEYGSDCALYWAQMPYTESEVSNGNA